MDEDTSSWPDDLPELKDIACLLKCGVCYEYVTAPVLTPCSHTYCSLCVRKWLVNKQVCPSCSSAVVESTLRRHLALERIVVLFRQLVKKLVQQDSGVLGTMLHPISNSYNVETHIKVKPGLKQQSKETVSIVDPGGENLKPELSRSPLTRAPVVESPSISPKLSSAKKVPCPVCSATVPERLINAHLDRCLSGDVIRETRATTSNINLKKVDTELKSPTCSKSPFKPQPLTKMVYNLMSESQLRKELKKHNLPTQGDRRTIQNRLQRFVVLYNAECDALEPRSMNELKAQLLNEEKVLSASSASTSMCKILKSARTDPKAIEAVNKEYIQKNNSHFNMLIDQIRDRNKTQTKVLEINEKENTSETSNPVKDKDDNETDSDEEYFTFTKSSKRKLNLLKDDTDENKSYKNSPPQKIGCFGKKGSRIASKPKLKVESDGDESSLRDGRMSPVLTRRQSKRKHISSHQEAAVVQKHLNSSPKPSQSDEICPSPRSSPTPDVFDDASVDSFILTPGQRTLNEIETISAKDPDEESDKDLSILVSLLDGADSSTDFEEI